MSVPSIWPAPPQCGYTYPKPPSSETPSLQELAADVILKSQRLDYKLERRIGSDLFNHLAARKGMLRDSVYLRVHSINDRSGVGLFIVFVSLQERIGDIYRKIFYQLNRIGSVNLPFLLLVPDIEQIEKDPEVFSDSVLTVDPEKTLQDYRIVPEIIRQNRLSTILQASIYIRR
jgi:hypothetical protein